MSTLTTTYTHLVFPFASREDELTRAYNLFQNQDAADATRAARILRDAMDAARRECATDLERRHKVENDIRRHPVAAVALEDPFIRRAFLKPRGYPGDAVLLDFIYHHASVAAEIQRTPAAVRAAMQFTTNAPGPRAVRNRAWLLAAEIDASAERVEQPEILSLACGHLREAGMSRALQLKRLHRFLALDQDLESIAVVRADCGHLGVEAAEGSVKTVIARGKEMGQFDFVYAAGLYDYLGDKVASRLLEALFERLKPGGKLWVANFMPDIEDRGFMEAMMDWWLIYRNEEQMLRLGDALPRDQVASMRTFVEHEDNIVFLEAVRHG